MEQAVMLFGSFDENIKLIEKEYSVRVIVRGSELKVCGDAEKVSLACKAIDSLLSLINKGENLNEQNVRYCISLVNEGSEAKLSSIAGDCICVTSKGKPIKPKTIGQKKYCDAIKNNTITIGVGPAGRKGPNRQIGCLPHTQRDLGAGESERGLGGGFVGTPHDQYADGHGGHERDYDDGCGGAVHAGTS